MIQTMRLSLLMSLALTPLLPWGCGGDKTETNSTQTRLTEGVVRDCTNAGVAIKCPIVPDQTVWTFGNGSLVCAAPIRTVTGGNFPAGGPWGAGPTAIPLSPSYPVSSGVSLSEIPATGSPVGIVNVSTPRASGLPEGFCAMWIVPSGANYTAYFVDPTGKIVLNAPITITTGVIPPSDGAMTISYGEMETAISFYGQNYKGYVKLDLTGAERLPPTCNPNNPGDASVYCWSTPEFAKIREQFGLDVRVLQTDVDSGGTVVGQTATGGQLATVPTTPIDFEPTTGGNIAVVNLKASRGLASPLPAESLRVVLAPGGEKARFVNAAGATVLERPAATKIIRRDNPTPLKPFIEATSGVRTTEMKVCWSRPGPAGNIVYQSAITIPLDARN